MLVSLLILLTSFTISFLLSIPFISLLYRLRFRTSAVSSKDFLGRSTVFNELHGHKVGTPTGGGILITVILLGVSLGYWLLTRSEITWSFLVLFLAIVLFGALGFLDDLKKIFKLDRKGFFALRVRHKILLQLLPAVLIAWLLMSKLGISSVHFPFLGQVSLGWWYLPYATLVITFFTNAFNITDGLDGLAGGLLFICLLPLWYLAARFGGGGETVLLIVIALGALLSFLYFNVNPARFFMGDTGAMALGALLAVISLLIDASVPLFILGGVFVVEGMSSLLQWGSMLLRDGKRIFKIAPLHHHFEALGWEETKVTERFWLVGILCALGGLALALVK